MLGADREGCYVCGYPYTEVHHIFSGTANRKLSDKYGFTVRLCHYHHNGPPDGAHFNRDFDLKLKRLAQSEYEKTRSRDDFIREFGKSWI